MPITRAQAEKILVSRVGGFLTRCGLSTAATGANADLADPIATALRGMGEAVADPTSPSDDDLAALADEEHDLFLGIATLMTLRACRGNWAKNDQRISLGEQKFNQIAQQIAEFHDALATDLLNRYGYGRRRRRQPLVASILAGHSWPPVPPPPASAPPWPDGYGPAPSPPPPATVDFTQFGFNP